MMQDDSKNAAPSDDERAAALAHDGGAERAPDARPADARRESGEPGGGQGRRDEVGRTGVYPLSAGTPEGRNLEIRTPAAWGQGERGAAGYEDAGGSELTWRDGQLMGGITSGPNGEPTIDIHGGDRPLDDASGDPPPPKRARDETP